MLELRFYPKLGEDLSLKLRYGELDFASTKRGTPKVGTQEVKQLFPNVQQKETWTSQTTPFKIETGTSEDDVYNKLKAYADDNLLKQSVLWQWLGDDKAKVDELVIIYNLDVPTATWEGRLVMVKIVGVE